MRRQIFIVCFLLLLPRSLAAAEDKKPEPIKVTPTTIDLGNRRELFVDDYLIAGMKGAERRLHRPTARQVAIVHDAPWEGNVCFYHTVFRDGDLYRMYYRGAHVGPSRAKARHQVVCYAESRDGIRFHKPKLGLHDFQGSKENNIVWNSVGSHNFSPFKDTNPDCKPEARYKAFAASARGIYILQSKDAIHWKLITPKHVITAGHFDSQNLAFYDTHRKTYVEYQRGFFQGMRTIMTATSKDFVTWTKPQFIRYANPGTVHLYTNQTQQYYRAPHILLAFPKRFVPGRNPTRNRNTGVSDVVLMSSRDGLNFDRWQEAFLRPGLQPSRWVNRNNFIAWGLVETKSEPLDSPPEISMYSMEGYYAGEDCSMRRYTLRPDGFVSVTAPMKGGELITKPLAFALPAGAPARPTKTTLPPSIKPETRHPLRGKGSLHFKGPGILSFSGTRNLGRQATLAVSVRAVPGGVRRLFSTYNGSSTVPGELYFDIDSERAIGGNQLGFSIRFKYNGILTGAKFKDVGNWSEQKDARATHHLAATWDDGRVTIYFDGRRVGSGGKSGLGDLKFALGDLRFGEDYPPTSRSNEPFQGFADDLLILKRALSAAEIAQLAKSGSEALQPADEGIFLNMDDPRAPLTDRLKQDGEPQISIPRSVRRGDVELRVNFSTSAAGSLRCEIQDQHGKPIPGYALSDSDQLYGDSLDQAMSWKGSREVRPLVGRAIRLRFVLRDADLYSLRFGR